MNVTVELGQQPDGGWSAQSPELPGIAGLGADRNGAASHFQALALRVIADRIARGEIGPEAASVSFELAKPYGLGILLVHGIGSQLAREVLVGWGDSIVNAINLATQGAVSATVGRAEHGSTRVLGAEAIVQVKSKDCEETWLMSEGWWADAFPVPTYGELVKWSVSALPWSIALHVAQEFWEAGKLPAAAKIVSRVWTILKLFVALLLAPLFIALLATSLLLGWLPVPQIRSWILAAQGTLANTIGDSLVFVESPMRAALIRTRILDAIERLAERCQRTIVIAHSQGAAIVVDALGGMVTPGAQAAGIRPLTGSAERRTSPDALLTFGAGVNPLAMLKALSSGTIHRKSGSPVMMAIGALVVAVLIVWIVSFALKVGSTTGWQLLEIHVGLVLAALALGALIWIAMRPGVQRWVESQFTRRPRAQRHQDVILVGSASLVIALLIGVPYHYLRSDQMPIVSVTLFWLSLLLLSGSFIVILSGDMERNVTIVRMPPGLVRWVDLYASQDPVPNGRVIGAKDGAPESTMIWNLGSVFADHTSYWNNLDGFVLRVVELCARTADSPWKEDLPAADPLLKRAKWRVELLGVARWIAAIMLATLSVQLWAEFGDAPLPWTLPTWLPPIAQAATRYTVLAGAILAAIWLSSRILRFIWEPWVRFEQKKALAEEPPGNVEWYALSGMIILILALFSATVLVAGRGVGPALVLVQSPGALGKWIAAVIPGAIGLTLVLLWLRPGPQH